MWGRGRHLALRCRAAHGIRSRSAHAWSSRSPVSIITTAILDRRYANRWFRGFLRFDIDKRDSRILSPPPRRDIARRIAVYVTIVQCHDRVRFREKVSTTIFPGRRPSRFRGPKARSFSRAKGPAVFAGRRPSRFRGPKAQPFSRAKGPVVFAGQRPGRFRGPKAQSFA